MVKKRSLCIIVITIFLLNFHFVYANGETIDPKFDPYYDSPASQNAATINSNIDGIAEAGRLHEVPVDKLSEANAHKYANKLSPQQKMQLNAKQLAHTGEDRKATLDKVKANEVSKTERNKALKQLGRTEEEIESETDEKPTQITTFDDGFGIDYIFDIRIGNVGLHEAEGLSYRNGVIKVNKAKTIFIKGGILSEVTEFEGNAIEFDVGDVRVVTNKCVTMYDVRDSHFRIDDNNIEVSPEKGVKFDIKDCSNTKTTFEAMSNESKIIVSKDMPPKYTIEKGILKCSFGNATDAVMANNTVSLDIGIQCFNCITIEPVGNYYYSEDLIKDFGINVPIDSSTYKLCLRRLDGMPFNGHDGLVDFVDKKIELNKIVNYLRYPFENNQILSLLMDMVYEGTDVGNKATMDLDDGFVFIDNFYLENNNSDFGLISYLNNGKYAVYEYNDGNEVRRYGRFNTEIKPDVIKKYNSYFAKNNPLITFADGIMVQEGVNDFSAITKFRAVYDGSWQKNEFEQNMLERSQYYPIKKGRCGG